MISNRFQKHSWFTTDGRFHVVIRDPETAPVLKLFRAQGSTMATFGLEYGFPGSGDHSTSDGVMIDDHLYLVYDTETGAIVFVDLEYSPATGAWALKRSNIVHFASNQLFAAVRPTIAIEPGGRMWMGCVLENKRGLKFEAFGVYASDDGGESWCTSTAMLPLPTPTEERSLRLIAGQQAVYAIYSDNGAFGLAVRQNGGDATSCWADRGLFLRPKTNAEMRDPHGTHFSATVDLCGDLHFASNNQDYGGLYMRYNLANASWNKPTLFDSAMAKMRAAYMEIATDQKGRVLAVFSATCRRRNCLVTFMSRDNGDTWEESEVLMPLRTGTKNARPEMPERLMDSQPILQQVDSADDRTQGIVTYTVPGSFDPP